MRENIKDLVEQISEVIAKEPIYEIGAWQSQPGLSELRVCFPGKKYIGCDIRQGPGVDIIMDIHDTALPSESVGTVLMLETIEHVKEPIKALNEIHRILKPDGIVLFSSAMDYPIHDEHDYWRFTPECFGMLLEKFTASTVVSVGDPSFPDTVVGIGLKKDVPEDLKRRVEHIMSAWSEKWQEKRKPKEIPPAPVWKRAVKLLIPPVFIKTYHHIKIILGKWRQK